MARCFGYGIFAMLCNLLWLHSLTKFWTGDPLAPSVGGPTTLLRHDQKRNQDQDHQTQQQIQRLQEQLSAVVQRLETTTATGTSSSNKGASNPDNHQPKSQKEQHQPAQQQHSEKQPPKTTVAQRESPTTSSKERQIPRPQSEPKQRAAQQQQQQQQEPETDPELSREKSLSACLLIKDDNDLLNEWLAYHTHALNLKYLVVAVDPNSATSPAEILGQWRNLTDLQVVEWEDIDFMPRQFLKKGFHIHPSKLVKDAKESKWHEGHEDPETVLRDNMMVANHRFRQVTFLSNCLRHMREQGKTYVTHVDTDEFIVLNPLLRSQQQSPDEAVTTKGPQKNLADYAATARAHEPHTVYKALEAYIYRNRRLKWQAGYPCISMPRLLFGSQEYQNATSSTTNATTSTSSSIFNTTLFETLRWRYHTSYDDTDRNAQPKVIVDVSRVDANDRMFHNPFSIHRPSMDLCRPMDTLNFHERTRFPLTVNHYVGSWERYYLSKNDTRRSERAYRFKAKFVSAGRDDWLEDWLDGFVAAQGPDRARQLLQDYRVVKV